MARKKRNKVVQGYINAFNQFKSQGIGWTVALNNQGIGMCYPYIDLDMYGGCDSPKVEGLIGDLIGMYNRCNKEIPEFLELCKRFVLRYNLIDGALQRDMDNAVKLMHIPFEKAEPTDAELIRMISERGISYENGKWYKTTKVEIQ